jgi:hypothetical protein
VRNILHGVKEEKNNINAIKTTKDNMIGNVLHRNCLLKHIIKGKIKVTEGEKEDVGSYWMTLRKREDVGN